MRSRNRKKNISLLLNKRSLHRNEKGIIFITALALISVVALVGTVSINTTTTDVKISNNYKTGKQAFYAAEAGAEAAVSQLRDLLNSNLYLTTSQLDNITAPTMYGYSFDTFTVSPLTSSLIATPITQGNFTGLMSFKQRYMITSEASLAGNNSSRAEVALIAEDNLIPLFQFAVFYEDDLEILPGPNMTFSGGRIHSNSDIYLGANNTLSIDSETSSAGDIFNYRKNDGSTMSGTVKFKDGGGVYQAMAGLDSDSPDWVTEAINRWGGNVKSKDHWIFELNLPIPGSSTAIEIIKPDPDGELDRTYSSDPTELLEGRYYWKAGLRIIDGTAYDKDGNSLDLTNGGVDPDPLSTKSFYDQREKKTITVTEVDIGLLQSNSIASTALNDPPDVGDPGILYINETSSNKAIRLVNGSTLPNGGLTVASENPVYVQGDYNVSNKPASIASDAVTILSNNWNDSNSTSSSQSLSNRIASNTTVNTVIMGGHVATEGGVYSGGLENFPRFLESWSGKTFTFSGSLVSLWQSEQATGKWSYGGKVYKAPIRSWTYGVDFNNLPPGTPRVRLVQKIGWQQNIKSQ